MTTYTSQTIETAAARQMSTVAYLLSDDGLPSRGDMLSWELVDAMGEDQVSALKRGLARRSLGLSTTHDGVMVVGA